MDDFEILKIDFAHLMKQVGAEDYHGSDINYVLDEPEYRIRIHLDSLGEWASMYSNFNYYQTADFALTEFTEEKFNAVRNAIRGTYMVLKDLEMV